MKKTKKMDKPVMSELERQITLDVFIVQELDRLDLKKDGYKIIEDPESYFKPYFERITTPLAIIMAKLSIFFILRKIDSEEEKAQEDFNYFSKKYNLIQWMYKLANFYNYAITTANYILDKHNDLMLDLYNEGLLSKTGLSNTMQTFLCTKEILEKDIKILSKCHEEILKEKKEIKDKMDIRDYEDLGNQP
jgi:hypothetical protein